MVHAHAVIGHLAHPEKALKEFRRVCKPGGIVAAREAKKGAPLAVLKPEVPKLREFWASEWPASARNPLLPAFET